MKTAFIYSDAFSGFDYGAGHPPKPYRLKLTYDLIMACGLLAPADPRLIEPQPVRAEDLLIFHTKEYINILQAANSSGSATSAAAYGLGPGDNPVFRGMFDWSRLVAGASLKAADLVDSNEAAIAFNISGGLHHAMAGRASGFCYINDPVLAIRHFTDRGRKVAYIDIDAHHGDGVQEAFYATDRVLTISLHETGQSLFPGSGFEQEIGEGAGKGYSVNIPLPPESDDEIFVQAFTEIVPALIEDYSPDIVVSQLGVDTFRSDPLAHLNLTTNGYSRIIRAIKGLAPKWVALGGGGYDIANVARAWTLAWAVMNDNVTPDDIPEIFFEQHPGDRFPGKRLSDEPFLVSGKRKEEMRREVERVIASVKEHIFRNW
jgi:acetoin utilization protein AcuC